MTVPDRAQQIVREMSHTCSGYPCEVVLELAVQIAQREADIARHTRRISELAAKKEA